MAKESGNKHKIYKEYVYEDMVMDGSVYPSALERAKHFRFKGDVVIASYPKTGTTWLQEMTWLLMNKGDTEAARKSETFNRVPFLEYIELPSMVPVMDTISQSTRPLTIKTHLPVRFFKKQLDEDVVKFLVIVRNPKDMLVSYYHFYQSHEFLNFFKGSFDEFFEMFENKGLLYGDFFQWYKDWWTVQGHEKVLFLKYEDMKSDLAGQLKRIATFLGKEFTEDEIYKIAAHGDFDAMKNNKMTNWSTVPKENYKHDISPFMRSGKKGGWKKYFSKEQNELVDERYEKELKANGLELDFE